MVGTAGASTINVNESDPNNYTTIQGAVNAAGDYDTILVYPGTYTENVDVNKKLNITSTEGASVTYVKAAASNDHVFDIQSNNVNISGFNISGGY